MKQSRAQVRLRKTRARQDAMNKLEGNETDVGESQSDFSQWLMRMFESQARGGVLVPSPSRPRMRACFPPTGSDHAHPFVSDQQHAAAPVQTEHYSTNDLTVASNSTYTVQSNEAYFGGNNSTMMQGLSEVARGKQREDGRDQAPMRKRANALTINDTRHTGQESSPGEVTPSRSITPSLFGRGRQVHGTSNEEAR